MYVSTIDCLSKTVGIFLLLFNMMTYKMHHTFYAVSIILQS